MKAKSKARFKVGDKVVRTARSVPEGVEKGKTYTVVDVHNKWLKLEGFEEWGCGFNPECFEAALKWNPQIGDTIAKIIPKGQPKEVQSNSTSPDTLEFRIRVLEKENELLTRLLLKGGLL